MPFLKTLSTRIAVPAGFFVLVSVALLASILIRAQREQTFAEILHGSESIAEALSLSIDHDMRVNHRDGVREVIDAVGTHSGIDAVRLLNKDGKISYSSRGEEVGGTVDMRSEACASCHSASVPTSGLDPSDRSRIYTDPNGKRILATVYVIRNEEGCQGGGCHVSPRKQSVLGVLDVAMDLEPAEARLASATERAILVSLAAVLFITLTLFWFVRRSVRIPIRRIVNATRQVASGDPSLSVPRGAASEFTMLASSVNEMIEGLASSKAEMEAWSNSLEDKLHTKAVELRDAQFQVAQAERLTSVGLVAAGIAHELNSPLMAIITFTHLVRDVVSGNEQASADLRMIEHEAHRCASIIRQLLDFSRKQSSDPPNELCDIPEAIAHATDLIKVELQNANVAVHLDLPADLPIVEANRVQLMQIFVNLVLNAFHAMPNGGDLTIRGSVVDRDAYASVDYLHTLAPS